MGDWDIASIAIWTGVNFGFCLCIISCFTWYSCLKYRLRSIGKSTEAYVSDKNIRKTINPGDPSLGEGDTTITTYEITFSYKIIITKQSLRYVLQQMAKAYNVYLPVDIIDLCLEYVANSFIIYRGPIKCNQAISKKEWYRTRRGQTFNIRYDPKYPMCNDESTFCGFGGFGCVICCGFVVFGVMFVISYFWWYNSNPMVSSGEDRVFLMVWITCVSMIFVVLIVVCCIIYVQLSYGKLKYGDSGWRYWMYKDIGFMSQQLQCMKILDGNTVERESNTNYLHTERRKNIIMYQNADQSNQNNKEIVNTECEDDDIDNETLLNNQTIYKYNTFKI